MLDQSQFLASLGAHQREGSLDLLAAQQDAELSFSIPSRTRRSPVPGRETVFLAFVGRIDAAIPDDDLACAVLPGGITPSNEP